MRAKTICAECQHAYPAHQGQQIYLWLCTGPWPKTINPVTGEMGPKYERCESSNHGDCKHFTPKPPHLLLPIWNFLISE